jgi:hypothetical protein
VAGIDPHELRATAVLISSGGVEMFVMHPVLMMFSRAYNVARIGHKYDNRRGIAQLKASIICAREYIGMVLDEDGVVAARRSAERVFRFALTREAQQLRALNDIDLFDAVECHAEYGKMFSERRYPQMLREIARARR